MYKFFVAVLAIYAISIFEISSEEIKLDLNDLPVNYTLEEFKRDFPKWERNSEDNTHISYTHSGEHAKEFIKFFTNGSIAEFGAVAPIAFGVTKCDGNEEIINGECVPVLG